MPFQAIRSLRVGVVAVAPVLLLAVLGFHPYLAGRQPNIDALGGTADNAPGGASRSE